MKTRHLGNCVARDILAQTITQAADVHPALSAMYSKLLSAEYAWRFSQPESEEDTTLELPLLNAICPGMEIPIPEGAHPHGDHRFLVKTVFNSGSDDPPGFLRDMLPLADGGWVGIHTHTDSVCTLNAREGLCHHSINGDTISSIAPFNDGWLASNLTGTTLYTLNSRFQPTGTRDIAQLTQKDSKTKMACCDSHVVLFDINNKTISFFDHDLNWLNTYHVPHYLRFSSAQCFRGGVFFWHRNPVEGGKGEVVWLSADTPPLVVFGGLHMPSSVSTSLGGIAVCSATGVSLYGLKGISPFGPAIEIKQNQEETGNVIIRAATVDTKSIMLSISSMDSNLVDRQQYHMVHMIRSSEEASNVDG